MPEVTINGQVIDIPETGDSPTWSQAIITFAQAVEDALALTAGEYDIAPQSMNIAAYNTGSNVDVTNLSFPITDVRAAFIRYAVYRTTDTTTAYEAGDIVTIYNANGSVGAKWALTVGNVTGTGGNITFTITDAGQVQFTTTSISGASHTGRIIYEARALEQS